MRKTPQITQREILSNLGSMQGHDSKLYRGYQHKKTDGSIASTAHRKADTFNESFSSVFTRKDLSNIPCTNKPTVKEDLSRTHITPDIVYAKLRKLNSNNSPDHDNWHSFFIRELAKVICVPLSILFGKSLKERAHKSWLQVVILPVYNKGTEPNRTTTGQ